MRLRYLALCASLILGTHAATAQTPSDSTARTASEEIALGDSAAAHMQPPAEALAHYQAALAMDSTNYVALCRASRDAVAQAEFEKDKDKRQQLFLDGERYARAAVKVRPDDAEGHFFLARALGRVALTKGKKDRVKYGKEVYQQAQDALRYDPSHAGALHVMGMWNYEVMSLSGFSRFMAKTFLGGGLLGKANWADAQRYMEQSVQADPDRLVHHLDLGKVYERTKQPDKAREQFEIVMNRMPTEYNDRFYKQEAESHLSAMDKKK